MNGPRESVEQKMTAIFTELVGDRASWFDGFKMAESAIRQCSASADWSVMEVLRQGA